MSGNRFADSEHGCLGGPFLSLPHVPSITHCLWVFQLKQPLKGMTAEGHLLTTQPRAQVLPEGGFGEGGISMSHHTSPENSGSTQPSPPPFFFFKDYTSPALNPSYKLYLRLHYQGLLSSSSPVNHNTLLLYL